jgi:sulfonate transport system ATP-binding protein
MVQVVVPDAGAPVLDAVFVVADCMRMRPLQEPRSQAATHAGTAAMRFRGVTIEFALPRGGHYPAVAATDLAVGGNEFVAIVGPTGCGKSTLLNVAAGLLAPTSGAIEVLGAPLAGLNLSAGYLFQQDAVMPWKTARDNVAIGLEVAGITRAEALARAQAWLQRVGLAAFGERYPHQLSGGQRKRVGLAQVLIRDPKILLMDEPFGPLDAQTRQIMGNLLLELWAGDRKAVLFVTHDLEEAIALADRVIIMSAGPAARVIGDYAIDLGRPRDAQEVRLLPRFHELHKAIWGQLRAEVLKAYAEEVA